MIRSMLGAVRYIYVNDNRLKKLLNWLNDYLQETEKEKDSASAFSDELIMKCGEVKAIETIIEKVTELLEDDE